MNNEQTLRDELLKQLQGGRAYMTFQDAVKDFPMKQINTKFPNGNYSPWALLEHIRITQKDILEFMTNDKYQEMQWPQDYWPPESKLANEKDWKKTIDSFEKDSKILQDMVQNPQTNLYKVIHYHGEKFTILREILVVVDHNAYHIGEFAIMRQTMNTWNKSR